MQFKQLRYCGCVECWRNDDRLCGTRPYYGQTDNSLNDLLIGYKELG